MDPLDDIHTINLKKKIGRKLIGDIIARRKAFPIAKNLTCAAEVAKTGLSKRICYW